MQDGVESVLKGIALSARYGREDVGTGRSPPVPLHCILSREEGRKEGRKALDYVCVLDMDTVKLFTLPAGIVHR